MNNILIITSSIDLTVDYIIDKYKELIGFYRLNTDLIDKYEIALRNEEWLIKCDNWELKEDNISGIYYRKPMLPVLDMYETRYHHMMSKEIIILLHGIAETFSRKCLTKPSILNKADNKLLQLKLAKNIGFTLPTSLITNSNSQAKAFCKGNFKNIVKPISVGKINWDDKVGVIQTNVVDQNVTFTGLELCPAYFQEYQQKDYELRVTVVDNKFYPVSIRSTNKIDWRKNNTDNVYSLVDLPFDIEAKCLELMESLELKFGAFDFIVKDNIYIFLEINPNGQWLWLEQALDLDISRKIIDYLAVN